MKYRIDALSLRDGTLVIEGWAYGADKQKIKASVTDKTGAPVKYTAVERDRADVMQQFGADRMCGITVAVPFERGDEKVLVLTDGPEVRKIRLSEAIIEKKNSIRTKRSEKLLALCHLETLRVAWDFYKENGLAALWKKSVHKIRKIDEDYDYPEWELKTRISEEELARQRAEAGSFAMKPLISVVIPAYNTGEQYLRMLFDSLEAQVYGKLEIVVADGSEDCGSVEKVTLEYAARRSESGRPESCGPESGKETLCKPTYKYLSLGGNRGIAGNTNAGLKAATGAYIALCDHDDELPPSAFYYVVKAICENPAAQFIYTDEDKIDFDGKAVFEPHFKSDYNPELLTSVNYICHLSVIRKDLLDKVGGFDPAFDGAQDHDFFLRVCEEATREETKKLEGYREALKELKSVGLHNTTNCEDSSQGPGLDCDLTPTKENIEFLTKKTGFSEKAITELMEGRFTSETIVHVPKICYHWRYHKGSTAENPASKLYAFEAGARAVGAHHRRKQFEFTGVEKGVTYGYYHTQFAGQGGPLHSDVKLSVIIPNKDHIDDLDKCIRSIMEKSLHRNIEFIVVENNSTNEETFDYYRKNCEICHQGQVSCACHRGQVSCAENAIGDRFGVQNLHEGTVLTSSDKSEVCPLSAKNARETCPQVHDAGSTQMHDAGSTQMHDAESTQMHDAESTQMHDAESTQVHDAENTQMRIKVVTWGREFNYSAINNFGERFATGDVILLLNNDVEIIGEDAITEMIAYALKPEVGAVGARLNYGDDTIQHGGVIVGLGGIAGAAFVGLHEKENSYMHRMMCVQDYSAVTAACLMMRREVFEEVGGLREALAVAFNDIDLCMKVRAHGYRVVYDPYSTWHHYESKSRGLEDTPEKVMRFNGEIATFASHWDAILKKGDPYYHPCLTLRKANFALKDLMKEKIGEPYKLELNVEEQLKIVQREKLRRGE